MRWLALHLPRLPLEVHTRGLLEARPLAVAGAPGGHRISFCNAMARRAGVVPGQPFEAARALCRDLCIRPRRPEAERRALEEVAAWAGQFSALVSLAPPAAVVLEAAGSLRLFGGAHAFLRRVEAGAAALGYRCRLCLAPTPAAALLLAGAGGPRQVDRESLRSALGRLPVAVLGLEAAQRQTLAAMGLRRLEELWRLPRQGLARRLGSAWPAYLDRLLGAVPDPRPPFQPPPHFRADLELPAEVAVTEGLLFAARRLLEALGGFLTARQQGALRLDWTLFQGEGGGTPVTLALSAPERGPGRLLGLLRERFERLALTAPVRGLRLCVTEMEALAGRPLALFPRNGQQQEGETSGLLDRLRSRLGEEAVQGLQSLPDHRPERAWRYCGPEQGGGAGRRDRPCWLCHPPRPLEMRAGRPWYRGRLAFEGERERVEAGWWDGCPVARDYFVARNPRGERLWIYHEGEGRWFLHGIFG